MLRCLMHVEQAPGRRLVSARSHGSHSRQGRGQIRSKNRPKPEYLLSTTRCCVDLYTCAPHVWRFVPVLTYKDATGCIRVSENTLSRKLIHLRLKPQEYSGESSDSITGVQRSLALPLDRTVLREALKASLRAARGRVRVSLPSWREKRISTPQAKRRACWGWQSSQYWACLPAESSKDTRTSRPAGGY